MDTSYNPVSPNYINVKFKDMVLQDTSQERSLIHQKHDYFSVLLSEHGKPQNVE